MPREVGVIGATMLGLGSIIGTGVFVSIGIAAGVAGPAAIASMVVAAVVATCNGLSSAQLAACHPVSGGTYEYGYRWLDPRLGFTAGWMFLCAKSASAATAALGFAGYLMNLVGQPPQAAWRVGLALLAVAFLTGLAWQGIKRSSQVNSLMVLFTILSLCVFILASVPTVYENGAKNLWPFFAPTNTAISPLGGFLEACALMFVAFTGYGRIATLAEEVRDPSHTIPQAIMVTLSVATVLYVAVGFVGVATVGASRFAAAGTGMAAPLEVIAREFPWPAVSLIVAVGAMIAMLGVLLNLILGLSRVVLAMGRRQDLPSCCARLDARTGTPTVATWWVGLLIGVLVLLGDVKVTWSFSAFTVLIYYAITNLAALRLSVQERFLPRSLAWLGLASCLFLAFWVEPRVWSVGLLLIVAGLIWHAFRSRIRAPSQAP